MATATTDIIAPKVLIVPTNTAQTGTPITGMLVVSNARLMFYNGSSWDTCDA